MQGYVTSEPFAVETQGKFKPKIFLLADQGFSTYSTLIETRRDLVEKKPDLVQRFVDASAIGWYNYIYGDNKAANALIKKHNPEMTDALLAYSVAKMKEYGIVDSGDSLKAGIGAMTDARMKDFFDKMARAGVVKPDARLQKGLYAAIRQQGCRRRSAAEAVTTRDGRSSHTRTGHRFAARRRQDFSERRRGLARCRPSISASANSSRCSALPAAASRRRLRIIAGLTEPQQAR